MQKYVRTHARTHTHMGLVGKSFDLVKRIEKSKLGEFV
jgi:hypothetical protein